MVDTLKFEDLVAAVHAEAASGSPRERLAAAVDASGRLSSLADRLLDHFVRLARQHGASWTEIGGVLGVSKQAAQQRFPEPSGGTQTRSAYAALVTAEAEALALSHNYVGTEHILLALARNEQSDAGRILRRHGVTSASVKRHAKKIVAASADTLDGPLPWTPRARRTAKIAGKHARRMGCHSIQSGHILLALLEQRASLAAQILVQRHELDPAQIREEVIRAVPDGEA